jgi:predicted N-acyltransferase
MPQTTYSAHWLAHQSFADAVDRYLERETQGMQAYVQDLQARNPFKASQPL